MMYLGADPSELIRMWHAREGQTFATHSSRKMQCPCVADRVERAKASRRLRTAGRPNTVCHVWGLTIRPRGAHGVQGLQGETKHNTATHEAKMIWSPILI